MLFRRFGFVQNLSDGRFDHTHFDTFGDLDFDLVFAFLDLRHFADQPALGDNLIPRRTASTMA